MKTGNIASKAFKCMFQLLVLSAAINVNPNPDPPKPNLNPEALHVCTI